MKNLLIALIVFGSLSFTNAQDLITIKATFDGIESEKYLFTEKSNTTHIFDLLSKETNAKYDLTNDKFKGLNFKLTYTIKSTVDEKDNLIEVFIIEDLEVIGN